MKKIRQKTGYTLAEVLLTVGILGVLAAVWAAVAVCAAILLTVKGGWT